MSHPILRKTAIGVGLFWLAVFLFVIVQSVLNVPIAGIKPEAVRLTLAMTFPFTAGHIRRDHWRRVFNRTEQTSDEAGLRPARIGEFLCNNRTSYPSWVRG